MLKVSHVLAVLAVICISAVIAEKCLFTDQMWGNENPTKMVFCNSKTNEPQEADCATGYGFISNETVSGCIPWSDWNDDCILNQNIKAIESCEGENSLSPHPVAGDPTSYYLCSSSSAKPSVLRCAESRGFVAFGGYLGCIPWNTWKNVTGCSQ